MLTKVTKAWSLLCPRGTPDLLRLCLCPPPGVSLLPEFVRLFGVCLWCLISGGFAWSIVPVSEKSCR